MKTIMYVFIVALGTLACQQEKKIGYVDNGTVINQYQEKRDVEDKFQAREEAFTKRADSISKAFQLEVQQTQIDARKASQKKAQELIQGLQQKQQMLQQQMQFEQQQLSQAFQTEIDSLIIKVKTFVRNYGKDNGYTYILGTSDAAASVLYGTDENNLTQIILDALNAAYQKQ
ncbi:OmpH family outer membrane protein [Aestuariivivens sediminis]|uniref:OmpH family outer membrane protein n=1 Tax=Aestuariivivens sediminis TaxID=2913557 RepID=UPI001F5A7BE7|nr:OmpH family outer membrane protein [Aestuariivivens sediminis]